MSIPAEHERLLKVVTKPGGEIELLAREDGDYRVRVDRGGELAVSIILTDEEFESIVEVWKAAHDA